MRISQVSQLSLRISDAELARGEPETFVAYRTNGKTELMIAAATTLHRALLDELRLLGPEQQDRFIGAGRKGRWGSSTSRERFNRDKPQDPDEAQRALREINEAMDALRARCRGA